MTSLVPIGGMLADYLRKNNIMTTTNVRKLFNCGGFGLEAFFFVLVAYANNKVSLEIARNDLYLIGDLGFDQPFYPCIFELFV